MKVTSPHTDGLREYQTKNLRLISGSRFEVLAPAQRALAFSVQACNLFIYLFLNFGIVNVQLVEQHYGY